MPLCGWHWAPPALQAALSHSSAPRRAGGSGQGVARSAARPSKHASRRLGNERRAMAACDARRQRAAAAHAAGGAPVKPAEPDPYADSDAPRWLKYLWRTLSARHVFTLAFVLVFPFVASNFFTYQVAAQSLVLGPDRAVADLPGRLRRHGVAGADDGGRHRRLCGGAARQQQLHRRQPELAVVGRGAAGAVHRHAVRDADRLAVGAHRRHLHDHDHARHRRGVLLPGAAELHAVQRLPGAARTAPAHRAGHRPAPAGAVLLHEPWPARWPVTSWCAGWSARPSAWRCRAFATTRGAWKRSASTSSRTASPRMRWPV